MYTDVWASMGQEEEAARRRKALETYQINRDLLKLAKPDVIVLHCLPPTGRRSDRKVFEGPHAAIFDEVENRLHAQKAIMTLLMG